ncbi:MAG: polymer-forming cytoskeletal protein [Tannerella sp.]|jgi:cytoskeletal protein CcmA (bactofilin family)|nr:polymer-forming cytoskeletal protein [Tannerella sp.]
MVRTKQNEEMPASNGGILNVLAVGTAVKGSVVTASDFRLDGRIEGDITCKGKIVIGPKGSIKGNIRSENAEILGEVEGCVRIREKLVFKSTAVVKGDVFIQTLEIEPGARFNGTCTMSGKNPLDSDEVPGNEAVPVNTVAPPPAR